MKRIAIIVGSLICLYAAAVLSLPFILSSDFVRGRILTHLTSLTGSTVTFRGDPSVSFRPFLGIELSDLTVKDPNDEANQAALLHVESVKAKLDLLPALLGDIEISEYQLVRPELNLIRRAESRSSWNFTSGALHDALKNSVENTSVPAKLGSFDVIDGSITYEDTTSNTLQKAAGIRGMLNWSDTNNDMSLDLKAVWRNEAVNLQLNIDEPLKIFAGGESVVSAGFQSVPLSFELNGEANMLSDLFVDGYIEAETPSINRMTEFLDTGIGDLKVIGAWQASGKLNATTETTLLSDATIQINDKVATGVVRIAKTSSSNGQKIDGTLAFDSIELTDYLAQDKENSDPMETGAPSNLDIDLRISANTIDTGRFKLTNVAAAINSSESGWQFDIGNAEAFGGSLVAQIASEISEAGPQLSMKFNTKASDATELESLIGEHNWSIDGQVDLKGDLRTHLKSPSLSDHRFNGELGINSQDGSIDGINLIQVFDGIQEGKFGVVSENNSEGETLYKELDLKVFLSNNIASISKASITTPDTQIQLLGDADLSKGTLAVRAQRLGPDGPIPGRIIIGGTLNDPLVTIRSIPEPADIHPDEDNPDLEENETKEEAG